MSYFNIGGNTGYALGPIVVTPLVVWLGLGGGTLAMLPVLVMAFVILRALPALQRVVPECDRAAGSTRVRTTSRAMTLLSVVIGLRSVAWFGAAHIRAAVGRRERRDRWERAGRMLSLMLVSGAVGTLVLGPVADRVGLRRTLLVTQAALPFLVVTFVAAGGIAGTIALMLVGPASSGRSASRWC